MGDLRDDLLFGASKVAEFVGVDVRKVYHWMDRRKNGRDAPPVFDVGGQVCARRSEMSSWFSGYRDLSSRRSASEASAPPENTVDSVISGKSDLHQEASLISKGTKHEQMEGVRE